VLSPRGTPLTRSLDWPSELSAILSGAAAGGTSADVRKGFPMPRPRSPRTRTRPDAPLRLEVIERSVYVVTDGELAQDVRRALAEDDIERLADLLDFIELDGPHETGVLMVTEVCG
jgi:hypothetical protein